MDAVQYPFTMQGLIGSEFSDGEGRTHLQCKVAEAHVTLRVSLAVCRHMMSGAMVRTSTPPPAPLVFDK
jgi:hypothetical protein